jgi:hypothetical protein
VTIEICKQIASELEKRYMEIMDYGGDQSEADSVGTPFKDGHLAIEFALKEIERLRAERDEARREVCQMKGTVRWNHYFPHFDPKGYAENRGWDCHKDYK